MNCKLLKGMCQIGSDQGGGGVDDDSVIWLNRVFVHGMEYYGFEGEGGLDWICWSKVDFMSNVCQMQV